MAGELGNNLPPQPSLTTSAGNDRQGQAEQSHPSSYLNHQPQNFMQKFRLYKTRSVFILFTIHFLISVTCTIFKFSAVEYYFHARNCQNPLS